MSSKAKLKFRTIDTVGLTDSLEHAIQFSSKVEELLSGSGSIDNLPPSIVPTEVLYNLSCGYEILYNRLMEYELLKAGYPKTLHTYH